MSTVLTINSLQRYDFDAQFTNQPNPFDFIIPYQTTSNWSFEKQVFTKTTKFNVTDGYKAKVCKVMIPTAFVPEKQPLLFLDIKPISTIPLIDKTIGPHIKSVNLIGYTGVTGCYPYPGDLPNYNNTWALFPCGSTNTHYLYESCGTVSLANDWKGMNLHVRIRDLSGYTLVPPYPPANGYTGFGNMCDFSMSYEIPMNCKPNICDPDFAAKFLAWRQECLNSKNLVITPGFAPFFQEYNQVMIVLNIEYVEIMLDLACNDQ